MAAPTIIDPFFRQLYNRIVEDLDSRVNALARGSALVLGEKTGLDPNTIAMKYQAVVAHIAALQEVIDLGIEIDRERYGTKTKQFGEED